MLLVARFYAGIRHAAPPACPLREVKKVKSFGPRRAPLERYKKTNYQ
jgi:hypothetical protein